LQECLVFKVTDKVKAAEYAKGHSQELIQAFNIGDYFRMNGHDRKEQS
jgi:hypothetical protein